MWQFFKNLFLKFKAFITKIFSASSKEAGVPTDQNPPPRRYEPHWKVSGYFDDAMYAVGQPDFDHLQKDLGDNYITFAVNRDKDWSCKFGGCPANQTYFIEHPGWADDPNTEATHQGEYLEYDNLKTWVQDVVAAYNKKSG